MGKGLVFAAILIFAGGCSTGTQSSDELNYSLNAIYNSVEANLGMGIQSYSENHREITSRPFIVIQSAKAKKSGAHERGRATVTILGSQRPYIIEVTVAIEQSDQDSEYSVDRYDKGLADKLLRNILGTLDKNDRNRNVIDDYQPF